MAEEVAGHLESFIRGAVRLTNDQYTHIAKEQLRSVLGDLEAKLMGHVDAVHARNEELTAEVRRLEERVRALERRARPEEDAAQSPKRARVEPTNE